MCVPTIIDASVFGEFLRKDEQGDGWLLRQWIEESHGTVIYSQSTKYQNEMKSDTDIFRLFDQYRKNKGARLIHSSKIGKKVKQFGRSRIRSNDPYVLALALASDARVLYTNDRLLKKDFTNRNLLPKIGKEKRAIYPAGSKQRKQCEFLRRRRCPPT